MAVETRQFEDADEGLVIAVSALQLAAVLEGESVEQSGTPGNRLIGALRLLGCAAEGVTAGALWLTPEPTTLTKIGGTALAIHAADQCTTGGRQLWTGRDERSLTERSTSAMARSLGASPDTAQNIGMAVDFMVPIGGAIMAGAVRAAAVRSGRISLMQHEAQAGTRLGGHTIARHVGKDEAFLRQRIAQTATGRAPPPAISSFTGLRVAEEQISRALKVNQVRILQWSKTAPTGATLQPPIVFDAGRIVGHGVIRSSGQLQQMSKLRVVIKKESYNGMTHYILTAFPVP
ncbi:RNase A-like domain-containing protein [Agrobacterium sp. BA1120]|uniref:RNase A-like domain-containing protein n=1 Tax=Agrobacterium sp. BA1120 TaxID=3228927 RepID=UPI00336A606B